MPDPANEVVDLVFGRFRGQILYADAVRGVFDHLTSDRDVGAPELASIISADPGLLSDNENKAFRLTAKGG
jgi:hypothetical protein